MKYWVLGLIMIPLSGMSYLDILLKRSASDDCLFRSEQKRNHEIWRQFRAQYTCPIPADIESSSSEESTSSASSYYSTSSDEEHYSKKKCSARVSIKTALIAGCATVTAATISSAVVLMGMLATK
jgi:hypothetical protein